MAKALPALSELTACPYCGADEFYVQYVYSGTGAYYRRYDGEQEGVDNSGMHDKLMMKPGKRAFCVDCHKPVARYDGERE